MIVASVTGLITTFNLVWWSLRTLGVPPLLSRAGADLPPAPQTTPEFLTASRRAANLMGPASVHAHLVLWTLPLRRTGLRSRAELDRFATARPWELGASLA
jgi:hypothetical protein